MTVITLFHCSGQNIKQYEDKIFDGKIKTANVYAVDNNVFNPMVPPVISMKSKAKLLLEFDELTYDAGYLYVKLIHCNADWTPSDFFERDYLNEYNEWLINDFDFSMNTKAPYVHYSFEIPRVKLPGNYAVLVYRDQNPNKILFTKRCIIYDETASIGAKLERSTTVNGRVTNQKINYAVSYGGINVQNPLNELKTVVLQNQRWDNQKTNLRPTFVNENAKQLRFETVDDSNEFFGWNEFRFIDLRGLQVNHSGPEGEFPKVKLLPVEKRSSLTYSQPVFDDLNGQFYISNSLRDETSITSEYAETTVSLKTEKIDGSVYILGAFNYWKKDKNSEMIYNSDEGAYEATLLLKQGRYDYLFYVDDNEKPPYFYEGSFFDTENNYQIIVYYRPAGGRGDLAVGYQSFNINN
ncbi:type IX secretion system plug protein [Marinigracilibium pacificum]|uniref:DUF5103 domain-containing protein n=1 Tax=Marinigracilibium pacificum TaxID=2729599 RepID=A0A848IXE4_9BACT|nr:type IX secretion system plug protein domain-containing protein [Marinigracilibium pacificum]NMM49203.1 DUF5103 domain-containing protein [Marinigracilibium pacificum]